MKKILTVLLPLSMLIILTSCTKEPVKPKNETTQKTSNVKETYSASTDNGDYKLTIEKVRLTDKRDKSFKKEAKKVVFLDYTYENISFGGKDLDLLIESDAFEVLDDKKNVLDAYPVYDEKRIPQLVSKGKKCSATSAYALNSDSTNLTISFLNSEGKKVFTAKLPIE